MIKCGEKRWHVTVVYETFKTCYQMENSSRKRIRHPFRGPLPPPRAEILFISQFAQLTRTDFTKTAQKSSKVLSVDKLGRCRRTEEQQCFRSLRLKVQRKRSGSHNCENNSYFHVLTVQKNTEENRHTSNPSQTCANVVEDINGCLLGEEDDEADPAKKTLWKRIKMFGAFLEASCVDKMSWTEKKCMYPEKNHFSFQ